MIESISMSSQPIKEMVHSQPSGIYDQGAFKTAFDTESNAAIEPVNSIFDIKQTNQKTAWQTYEGYVESISNHQRKQLETQQAFVANMMNQYYTDSSGALEKTMKDMDRQLIEILSTADNINIPKLKSGDINPNSLTKPAESMVQFLTRGENQLLSLEKEIARVFDSGKKTIDPADLLRFQLRMSHITQQLELFTSTLNKGLDSFKNVSNTQL